MYLSVKVINTQRITTILQNKNKIIDYVYCPAFTPYYFDSNLTRFAGQLSSDTACQQINTYYGKVSIGTGTFFINSNTIKVRTF
jgi:hypothetical protein